MDRISKMYSEPIIFHETVQVNADKNKVLALLRDPLRLTEWSLFFHSVEKTGDDEYCAYTEEGPREFKWLADVDADEVIMTYKYEGNAVQARYFVMVRDGATFFGEEFPIHGALDDEMVHAVRTTGLAELGKFKKVIEG